MAPLVDAYAAGFFDGEGCISLARSTPGRYCLQVHVGNNNRDVLDSYQSRFGGSVGLRSSGLYIWAIYSDNAERFLSAIFPYLRVKRGEAEAALMWCKMRRDGTLTKELSMELAGIIRDLKVYSNKKEA